MERVREVITRIGNVGIVRESPKLSALLGRGSVTSTEEREEEILSALPKTREFLDSLPYNIVDETEELNAEKATEATRLANKVENLIVDQERAIVDFRHQLTQLDNMTRNLQKAEETAASLHKQLLELTQHVASYEKKVYDQELEDIRRREQASFEIYKQERHQELSQLRQEYTEKLDDFQRERLGIIGKELGERTQRPSSASSIKRRSAAATLESVIEHEGLDDFFGDKTEDPPKRPGTAGPTMKASKASASVPKKKPAARRAAILADEDIDDDFEDIYKLGGKGKSKKKD